MLLYITWSPYIMFSFCGSVCMCEFACERLRLMLVSFPVHFPTFLRQKLSLSPEFNNRLASLVSKPQGLSVSPAMRL